MKAHACESIDLDMPRTPRGEFYRCGRPAERLVEPDTEREWHACEEHAKEAELTGFEVVRQCACGAAYTAEEWSRLERLEPMDDGDGGFLELRQCRCDSTISIPGTKS